MQFELDEQQRALQHSLARLLADRHDHETRRRIAASATGWSEPHWRQLVELGLAALIVPETHGGLGGTAVDLMVVMQEIGRSGLASPLLGSCVVPAAALCAGADEATQRAWLPALALGEAQPAWAHDEPGGDGGALWVSTRAASDGDRWLLDGRKSAVHHGASADRLVVSARVAGADGEPDGRALFLAAPDAPGLAARNVRLIDGTPARELTLRRVPAQPLVLESGPAARAIDAALAFGIAGTCAEMLGAMEAAMRLTLEYLSTRKQFGRTIGQNQALRHVLADMQVSLDVTRSMAIAAAVQAGRRDDAGARADLHRAKLVVGRHARSLTEAAIQLHGGIGMTEEYAVGHSLQRVLVLETCFGDGDLHAAALDACVSRTDSPSGDGSSV